MYNWQIIYIISFYVQFYTCYDIALFLVFDFSSKSSHAFEENATQRKLMNNNDLCQIRDSLDWSRWLINRQAGQAAEEAGSPHIEELDF
jgi:hypothetical protein